MRTHGTRIARYATTLTLSGILCKLLLIVFVFLATNQLGDELYGRLEYLVEFGLILAVLFDFGLEQTITRDLAGRREFACRFVWGFFVYRTGVGILLTAAYGLLVAFFFTVTGRAFDWTSLVLGAVLATLTFHIALFKAILRSQEKLHTEAWMNLVEKIVTVGLGSAVLILGFKLAPVISTYIIGGLAAFGIGLWVFIRTFHGMEKQFNFATVWSWQRTGVAIGLSAACILLLHREDTVMVNIISGDGPTGVYRASYRYFEGLFLVPQMLAVAAYPVFSAMLAEQKSVSGLASDILRFVLVLSLPLAVGGTVIADEVIPMLLHKFSPEAIRDAAFIFKILVWSLPPIYFNFILGTVLNAARRQNRNFHAAALALVCNFVLNIPAIYWFQGIGAAAVTILSQGLYCVFCIHWSRDLLTFNRSRIWTCVAAILASIGMGVVLANLQLAWWYDVVLGACIYAVLLLALRAYSTSDLQRIRNLLRP